MYPICGFGADILLYSVKNEANSSGGEKCRMKSIYYFVYGEDMDEVISGYRALTGKSQYSPKWRWDTGSNAGKKYWML